MVSSVSLVSKKSYALASGRNYSPFVKHDPDIQIFSKSMFSRVCKLKNVHVMYITKKETDKFILYIERFIVI